MRRLFLFCMVVILAFISAWADDRTAKAPPPGHPSATTAPTPQKPALSLTAQERQLLLGLSARAELVRVRAERELVALEAEQKQVLDALASRLKLTPETLRSDYSIDLGTSRVELKPKPEEKAKTQ